MASKREALGMEEPPSKKRVALRQITKDDEPDSEEEEAAGGGTFRRASDQVLAERRIVKVRRTPAAPSSAPNPFSAIRLVPPPTPPVPQESFAPPAVLTNANSTPSPPVAKGGEIEPPSTGAQVETSVEDHKHKEVVTGDVAEQGNNTGMAEVVETNSVAPHAIEQDAAGDVDEKKADSVNDVKAVSSNHASNRDEEVKARSTGNAGPSGASSVTFEQLSSAKNAFAGSFGTSFSSSPSNVNTSSLSHVSSGFAFGQPFTFGSGVTFGAGQSQSLFAPKSASQGAFPSVSSVFGTSNGSGPPAFGSFASSAAPPKPSVVSLQEIQVETGEEKEKAILTADASLFEFLDGGWKERGRGELRLNVSEEKDKRPRLVMRSKGNYRLLLNASLFPDMKLSKMDNRGISFVCANSAAEGKTGLTTYAVRLKDGVVASEFTATVEAYKAKGNNTTSEPRTPESSPKATERPSKVVENREIEA